MDSQQLIESALEDLDFVSWWIKTISGHDDYEPNLKLKIEEARRKLQEAIE